MRTLALLSCLFVLACNLGDGARAQPHNLRVEPLTSSEGVSDLRVEAIVQDQRGFMWFGTPDGLIRYDGYTSTTYRHDPFDSTSIAGPTIRVHALLEDSRGNLWVGIGGGGVDRYDPTTDAFVHYEPDPENDDALCSNAMVHRLYETRDGSLWVGHGTFVGGVALSRYDAITDSFRCFRPNAGERIGEGDHIVRALFEDRQGTLWVGISGGGEQTGLCRFDPSTNPGGSLDTRRMTCYRHTPGDGSSLVNNSVWAIHEDREGVFWVGTEGDGLHTMDREQGTFTRYPRDPNHPERLSGPGPDDAGGAGLRFIHEDGSGMLWFGGLGGVHRYDRTTRTQTLVEAVAPAEAIYEDREGTLWIGSGFAGGLTRVVAAPDLFRTDMRGSVSSLLWQERDSLLWVGTFDSGLFAFDREVRTSSFHPLGGIADLYEDRAGTVWIARRSAEGVDRFDPSRPGRSGTTGDVPFGTFTHFEIPWSNAIFEDRTDRIWVGTWDNGLYLLDREGRPVRHFHHAPGNPDSLASDDILSFYEDPSGALWIGTAEGLSRFDPATQSFTNFAPLGMIMVMAIREDSRGRLWIGSEGGGLHLFDPESGTSEPFTTEHGLAHNNVQDVLVDGQGDLWISTEKGLSLFDQKRRVFSNYSTSDGLPSEFFHERSGATGQNGEMLFGTLEGVVSFFPEQIKAGEPGPPRLLVTDFQLAGRPVAIGAGSPLRAPIWMTDAITLTYDQNDFGFTYAGIRSRSQSGIRYAYRLEGYDDTWRQVGTQRQASYTNMSPGAYVFRVRAVTRTGQSHEEGASIRVLILPPWWRTTWAYGLYLILALGGLFGAFRAQRRHVERVERDRTRERELEQAREIEKAYTQLKATQAQLVQSEKMASLGALTAGIAHEIKNPLNFVNNFAELNQELAAEIGQALDAGDPDEARALLGDLLRNEGVVAQHGKRADAIVRSMMQHASGGAGRREAVDLNALVSEYVDLAYHGKLAQVGDFDAEVVQDLGGDVGQVEVVRQDIGRVLLNLLSNALDAVAERQRGHRPEGSSEPKGEGPPGEGPPRHDHIPRVTIITRRTNGHVEIRVSDEGPGIPEEIREKIFEPFFTTKPTGSGTGLGLSLAYDIVTQGHGGTMSVERTEGPGATFIVTLPSACASR